MSKEKIVHALPGWSMLAFNLLLLLGGIALLISCVVLIASNAEQSHATAHTWVVAGGWGVPIAWDGAMSSDGKRLALLVYENNTPGVQVSDARTGRRLFTCQPVEGG